MNENETEQEMHVEEEVKKLMQSLPRMNMKNHEFIKYQGFWLFERNLKGVISFQKQFVARDTDIFISSMPKVGSTWLKSLLFAVVKRLSHPKIDESPLVAHHPQELVYSLESDVYRDAFEYPRPCNLTELSSPRLFSTHIPYTSLPESIKGSGCRILYLCRNPFDTLVSFYHFFLEARKKAEGKHFVPLSLEDIFNHFCEGRVLFGPFFEHVLAFWKMSLERPDKVLFLKYEDLKDDPTLHLKRLAEFIGVPFSTHEESEDVPTQIIDFCSIQNMKGLEVNKSGAINKLFEKKSYFRKGEVGDWINHFTPSMTERMNKLMQDKLEGTGLSFKLLP